MNLNLVNNLVKDMKKNKLVQDFLKELQHYLENNISTNLTKIGGRQVDSLNNEEKITTLFRDKMYTKRAEILNNNAKQTLEKGEMYYIYDQNSKMPDSYNLCACEAGKSGIIIEKNKNDLPNGAQIGSVLRLTNDEFVLDIDATEEIAYEIDTMKDQLLKEQEQYLNSKRIEGHIYEMGEKYGDIVCLFDITNGNDEVTEGFEEINFPEELLENVEEGDLFVYRDGKYSKK